ncbi:extracellular solute-binding protein [Paenibacillus flagellatus]|uniref:Sugar ABC transporter n=1 Tax=Paenibacillus flagellatus TaxID=2211139 RepID=A0A2V5K2M0_9BACL|nr:extracellular solute-binding protein [Paenibacillus flagellatus]PYI52862.1 sugar ABC transporter [Paenibacillus flagellatus]
MGKHAHKRVAGTVALALALGTVLAACGDSKDGGSGDDGSKAPEAAANYNGHTAPFEGGKFNPPVTMTTIGCTSDLKYKNGETFENNVALRWAKEKLGIEVKYVWSAPHESGACANKLRLSLSANEPMPDVLHVWANDTASKNLLQNLIDSGQFMDITQAFDQYASGELKRIMQQYPQAWNLVSKNNKRYGLPIMQLAHNTDSLLYIRDDWMKKLNLQPPKTIADLETIMDAFVNQDPDGNGKKDTVGIALSLQNTGNTLNFNNWLADGSWIFGAYGATPAVWTKAKNGGLQYGSVQPEMKPALAKVKEWIEKGYIDKEATLHDVTKASELAVSGKAGILPAPFWGATWPIGDLAKNVPGASMTAYPLPVGPDGKTGHYTLSLATHAFLINKNYKHPDAAFHYFNKLLEFSSGTPGSDMENGFMEGYDYAIVDGKVTKEPDKIPGGPFDVYKATLIPETPNDPSRNIDSFTRLSKLKPGEQPANAVDRGNYDCCKSVVANAMMVYAAKDTAYEDLFIGGATETMRSKGEMLQKLEMDTFTKIIYGRAPLDEFDKFVEKWRTSGGEAVTKEVNDWYKSVGGK